MIFEKGDPEKRNIYNFHLATCKKRPGIIDEDKKINKDIKKVMKKCEKEKEIKEEEAKSFTCPYCNKYYKGENLKHLLTCVVKAEGVEAEAKLKAFFENKTSDN